MSAAGLGGLGLGPQGQGLAAQGQGPGSTPGGLAPGGLSKEGKFGLAGLLDVIRMTDKDLNMLALGSDLTTFG